jgi:Region found in RelA / SpoT proteins
VIPAALKAFGGLGPDGDDDEQFWLSQMSWTVPKYSKKRVNKAAQFILSPSGLEYESLEWQIWAAGYVESLDIINNWRSSHNFPLNTFHVGLRRRAKAIDSGSITAQRIKRMTSIEAKLARYPTMTLSQMQDIGGCRAIVATAAQVDQLCVNYAESDIKHALHQKDNYIATPKDSGYRGVHLVYRYFSDRKTDYNTLKIEIQLRSQYQHAWATAVETVGAFVQQALKSSLGEQEWLRFFALMGSAIAARENTPLVPNTPENYADLVKEMRERATALDVANRMAAFGTALQVFEGPRSKDNHYYLIEVNHSSKTVNVTGFKQSESETATNKYLETEKKLKNSPNADAVLVSVDSMDALRRAYPNYFLDTGVFVKLMNEALKTTKKPSLSSAQLSLSI